MKNYQRTCSILRHLSALALAASLALPLASQAANVALATSPLATSTTSSVEPNVMFMLDNSGSMGWDHMPDDSSDAGSTVTFAYGYYGVRSSQCNQGYYDPNGTYLPPVYADGLSYSDASFTAACANGFSGSCTVNLRTGFTANQASLGGNAGGTDSSGPAYYYQYSGSQLSQLQKDYNSTSNTFYSECNSAQNASPGKNVFTKISLSDTATATTATVVASCSSCSNTTASSIKINGTQEILAGTTATSTTTTSTVASEIAAQINLCKTAKVGNCTTTGGHGYTASVSGSTVTITGLNDTANSLIVTQSGNMTLTRTIFPKADAAKLTNFANWYSFYRTRMLMMKTAAGRAFKTLDSHYRVGFSKISSSATPTIFLDSFAGTQRTNWYSALYSATTSGSTPLREALSNAGRYYAGQLSGADPVQYSCQQNFTIMSTDGFWNGNDGFKVNGSTAVGNQDGTADRPMYDGAIAQKVVASLLWQTKQQTQTGALQWATKQQKTTSTLTWATKRQILTGYLQSKSGTTWSNVAAGGTCTGKTTTCRLNATNSLTTVAVPTASYLAYGATCTVAGSFTSTGSTSATNTVGSGGTIVSCPVSASFSGTTNLAAGQTCAGGGNIQCGITSSTGPTYVTTYPGLCTVTYNLATGTSTADSTGKVTTCPVAAYNPTKTSVGANGSCDGSLANIQCSNAGTATYLSYTSPACTATFNAAGLSTANGLGNVVSCPVSASFSGTTTMNTGQTCTPGGSIQCSTGSTSTVNLAAKETCTVTYDSSGPNTPDGTGKVVTACSTTGGSSDSLADVAMYYYQTDLRTNTLGNCTGAMGTGVDVCKNDVFKTDTDNNTAQHMATFTLGMGVSGKMKYSSSYLSDSSGDFYSISEPPQTADSAATPLPICSWQANNTVCNWPVPGMTGSSPGSGFIENIDDLWHAAVNGHGAYFSATSPASLSTGLSNALASISSRKGASAAAATSTLNPVAGNNYAYVASYTTVKWRGNLEARTIDVVTGVINESASWCVESISSGTCPAPGVKNPDSSGIGFNCVTVVATAADCTGAGVFDSATSECREAMATSCIGTMPGKVGASSDTRIIKTANSTSTALINFDAAYATANPTNFSAAHINTMSQWPSLTATQRTAAEGANLINFLRGQTDHEDRAVNLVGALDNRLYRYREATLGDALESQPIYISKPVFSYADPGYSDFATLYASRVGTIYMGTNDGMLHAFSALDEGSSPVVKGGTERWAYVPSMVIPNLWKLADKDYSTLHANFVNGSPIISDICPKAPPATCSSTEWRTILVGGLNAGGRGYYALDITNPTAPTLLWEFTTTSGQGSTKDDDLGYSYGVPVITAKSDGTWVVLVTSGYNNTSPGDGKGYLYVLNAGTGAVISKLGTGVGGSSGLAKISAWSDAPASNRATYVYGGDLLGNVWRFDINTAGTPVLFATLMDPSGNPQPITTTPVLGKIAGKRIIYIGTGKYLETSDLTNTQKQTLYALKDDGSTFTNPAGNPRNSTTLVQQTLTEGTGVRTASNNPVNFNTGRGWYVDFPDSGERSNIESRLVQGILLVATIVPSNSVCSPGGYGWLNFFNYQTGASINNTIVSTRYDHSIVGINVLYIEGNPVIETVTSNNPTPTPDPDVPIPPTNTGFNGKRVLWRELNP